MIPGSCSAGPIPLGRRLQTAGGVVTRAPRHLYSSVELQGRSPKRPLSAEILRIENSRQASVSRDPCVFPSLVRPSVHDCISRLREAT